MRESETDRLKREANEYHNHHVDRLNRLLDEASTFDQLRDILRDVINLGFPKR